VGELRVFPNEVLAGIFLAVQPAGKLS